MSAKSGLLCPLASQYSNVLDKSWFSAKYLLRNFCIKEGSERYPSKS